MRKIKLFKRTEVNIFDYVVYEVGSLKEITNFNRVLNTAEFLTKTYKSSEQNYEIIDELLQEGTFVSIENETEYFYIIDDVKKTRKRKDGNIKYHSYFVSLAGVELLLQKTIMPNKSLNQLVVGEQKTIEQVLNDYFEVFFKPLWNLNYEIIIPEELQEKNVDEFTWKTPTLYDVINDIIPEKFKIKLIYEKLEVGLPKVILTFVDITETSSRDLNKNIISKIEYNKSLDQNPKHVSSIVENVIIKDAIKEKLIPQTTDVGVMDDKDSSTSFETTFGIGNIKKAYVEGNLEWMEQEFTILGESVFYGHRNGYVKIDITDFIIMKEAYDSLLGMTNTISFDDFRSLGNNALNYKNFYLFFEKGKNYIGGILENITQKILLTFTDFNLGYLLNYIAQNKPDNIIEIQELPYNEPDQTSISYFYNEDIKNLKLTIEYDVLDDIRFDIIKNEGGFGQFVQNQTSAYINFDKFKDHLEKIMLQLDGEEQVAFGRYKKNELEKPMLNDLYNQKIVAQLITIDSLNYVDFMAILTSKNNRIDSDAIINTQKRFYNIIDVNDSIRRYDYIETNVDVQKFNAFQNIEKANVYGLLRTVDRDNAHLASSWMKLSVYKTENIIYFFGKALDNKYIGKRIVNEAGYKATEGVFYTDKDTGEFFNSSLHIVETDQLPNDDYPFFTTNPDVSKDHRIYDFIKLKDSGEKIAFTVAMKVGEAYGDYVLGIYANYELKDEEANFDEIVTEFEVKVDVDHKIVFVKDIDLKALYDYELIDEEAKADTLIREIVSTAVVDYRKIEINNFELKINAEKTLLDGAAVGDSFNKEINVYSDLDKKIGASAFLNLLIFYEKELSDEEATFDSIDKTVALEIELEKDIILYGNLISKVNANYELLDEMAEIDIITKTALSYIDFLGTQQLVEKADLTLSLESTKELIDEMGIADTLNKNYIAKVNLVTQTITKDIEKPNILFVNTSFCEKITVSISNTNSFSVSFYEDDEFVSNINANSTKILIYNHELNGVGGGTGGYFEKTYKFIYGSKTSETELKEYVPEFCIPQF